MRVTYLLILAFLFLFSCFSNIDSSTYSEIQKEGREVAAKAQTALLQNVGEAIQKGGSEYAVEFCNLKASSIIDSINQEFNCTISRVSDRNRNPNAALSSMQENEIWKIFHEGTLSDTIVQNNKNLIFYKPIKIGMPACLKCHGNPESDINLVTQQKLKDLYPNDLATGYSLNDFRGLWKIEFEDK